jgi:hypothetical protein
MSESEKPRPSFEDVMSSWLNRYGHETMTRGSTPYPYMRVDIDDYPIALNALLQSLLKNGFTREEVESKRHIMKIQEELTPDVYDSEKLETWRMIIEKIWKYYINKEFANEDLLADPKYYAEKPRKELPAPKVMGADLEVVDDKYTPPESKLNSSFKGFGKSTAVYDEDFEKLLEELKK